MRRILSTTLAALAASSALAALALVPTDADARTYHHGRARVGVYIGAPVIAPWRPYYGYGYGYGYPYGYPYYAPAPVVVQEQPTVFIEQGAPVAGAPAPAPAAPSAAPQAQQQQYWYYCQDTQTYYPHVQTCTSPWQRVIPHAPQAATQ
jgi:hypothetical protein